MIWPIFILSKLNAHLDALVDVTFPPDGQKIKDAMKDAVLTLPSSISFHMIDTHLEKALKCKQTIAKIWLNPNIPELQDIAPITLKLLSLVHQKEFSNGVLCRLTVFKAEFGSIQVAVKFRKVEEENQAMSETEGIHAIHTEHTEGIRELFPRLYCFIDLVDRHKDHWEAIGTEHLTNITDEMIVGDVSLFERCYEQLKLLHNRGYSHGDPHLNNFMLDTRRQVKLIDQDEIQLLPEDPTMSKYVRILDYLQLLFWNNPLCNPFWNCRTVDQLMQQHQLAYKGSFDCHRIFITPYGFLKHRQGNYHDTEWLEAVRRDLNDEQTKIRGKTYWQYLEGLNNLEASISHIMKSMERIEEVSRDMVQLVYNYKNSP